SLAQTSKTASHWVALFGVHLFHGLKIRNYEKSDSLNLRLDNISQIKQRDCHATYRAARTKYLYSPVL
ncbi:MAG: hypothetical protein VB088_13525, partial [Sphaerochaeta sp.]|nr:hypothetical protein [Sphaerochaeta sp.]